MKLDEPYFIYSCLLKQEGIADRSSRQLLAPVEPPAVSGLAPVKLLAVSGLALVIL